MSDRRTLGDRAALSDGVTLTNEEGARLPNWFVLLGLVLIVASDYKFRRRTLGDSLSGSLDLMVLLEIGLFGLVGLAMAFQHLRFGRPPRASALMTALWVYAGILAASAIYAPFPTLAMVRAAQLLLIVAFAHLIGDRATPAQFRVFFRWFVGLMIVSIGIGLAYVAPTSNYQDGRFTWLHVHTVTAGSLLCVGLLLAVGLLTIAPDEPRRRRATAALVVCVAVILAALIMTKTRGSLGGAAAGLMVFAVLRVPRQRRTGSVVLMGSALVGILYFTLPYVESFLTRGESVQSVETLSNRTELWSVAWVDFQHKPLFGWGLTASRGLFFDAVQLGGAHNAIVNVSVDGGLFGLTAWLVFLAVLVMTMRRTWKQWPATQPQIALAAAMLVTLFVNGLTMEGIGSGAGGVFILLCILSAWVLSIQRAQPPIGRTPSDAASPGVDRSASDPRLPRSGS